MSWTKIAQLGFAALAASLLVSPAAMATNSAIDEYIEHFPSGGKEKPSSELGRGGGKLSPGARQDLSALGPDGAAAAALAEQGLPASAVKSETDSGKGDGGGGAAGKGSGPGGAGSGGAGGAAGADDDTGSGVGNLISELVSSGSGGGLGPGLPAGLGFAVLGAGLILIARRRGTLG